MRVHTYTHTNKNSELKEICYYQDACGQLLHNTLSQCCKLSISFAFPECYGKPVTFNVSACLLNQCASKYL